MDDRGGGERQSLGQFVRGKAKYGTTVSTVSSKPMAMSSKFIKHKVSQGDTLMGLSLRYNVPVELIKRANKMWTNDSLYLRDSLLVPLIPENEDSTDPNWDIVMRDVERSASFNGKPNHESENGASSSAASTSTDLKAQDFLSKYDSSIAQLKSNVDKLEKNAKFLSSMEDRGASARPSHSASFTSGASSMSSHRESIAANPTSPVLVIRSRTRARRVEDTVLMRGQRASDELFEL